MNTISVLHYPSERRCNLSIPYVYVKPLLLENRETSVHHAFDLKIIQKIVFLLYEKSRKVFGDGPINSMKTTFLRARKRIAAKLQNPRLLQISFHTFRHWKATMYYHETKNPLLVKELLGHQKLDTTLLYIQIEQAMYTETDDEFTVMAVKKPEEIKNLLEVGFEYVCQKDDPTFLRKRK